MPPERRSKLRARLPHPRSNVLLLGPEAYAAYLMSQQQLFQQGLKTLEQ